MYLRLYLLAHSYPTFLHKTALVAYVSNFPRILGFLIPDAKGRPQPKKVKMSRCPAGINSVSGGWSVARTAVRLNLELTATPSLFDSPRH